MGKYVDFYKKLHSKGVFTAWHKNYVTHIDGIRSVVKSTSSKLILDYGSGRGEQYSEGKFHRQMGVSVECYDPAVEKFSKLPEKQFDGIISVDAIEHIPEEELDETFKYIFSHADKFVYLVIHCGLAKKILANGENAHCTIKSPTEWNSILEKYNTKGLILKTHFRIPSDPKYNILNLNPSLYE